MERGRKKLLEKVPTRKLLAAVKRDMRMLAKAAKPKKK